MNSIQTIAFTVIIFMIYFIYHEYINHIIKSTIKNIYNFIKNTINFFRSVSEPETFDDE